MSEHRVDIAEPLEEIARRLGIEYHMLKRIEIEPARARALVYQRDGQGYKHVNLAIGEAVLAEHCFEVQT